MSDHDAEGYPIYPGVPDIRNVIDRPWWSGGDNTWGRQHSVKLRNTRNSWVNPNRAHYPSAEPGVALCGLTRLGEGERGEGEWFWWQNHHQLPDCKRCVDIRATVL